MRLSDLISQAILDMMAESESGAAEIKRNEFAEDSDSSKIYITGLRNWHIVNVYQTESRKGEGLHIGGHIPFEKVYAWNPYEGMSDEAREHIIGVQCNMWSEYIKDMDTIEVMLLPRLGAMAEVQWAEDRRDESTIRQKMETMRKFYDACGWNYAPYYFEGRQ